MEAAGQSTEIRTTDPPAKCEKLNEEDTPVLFLTFFVCLLVRVMALHDNKREERR